MVQASVVNMELSVEDTFKNGLYKKYESLKKVLIPKPEFFLLINELKHLNEQSSAKSHQGYYFLSKHDILQCGDVEKLIRRRKSSTSTRNDSTSTKKRLNLYQKQLNLYQKQLNLHQKQLNFYQKRLNQRAA